MGNDFSSLSGQFLKQLKRKGVSELTLKNYRSDFNHFQFFIGPYNGLPLSPALLKSYEKKMILQKLSANTRRRKRQSLKLLSQFLMEQGIITHSPLNNWGPIVRPEKKLQYSPWPLIRALEKKLSQRKSVNVFPELIFRRDELIFLLILYAGVKVSELEKILRLHLFTQTTSPRLLLIRKGHELISIPLPQKMKKKIKRYQKLLKNIPPFPELFFNANQFQIMNGGISARSIQLMFVDIQGKTKKKITPRTLRQACMVKWLKQKKPPSLIKKWLGFSPIHQLDLP